MTTIRLLTPADAELYWTLRVQALKDHPEAFATSYEEAIKRDHPIERVAQNLANVGNYTFGAFDPDKNLVGMVTLMEEQHLKLRHKANIFAMYVAPQMRSLGIGKQLLSAAIQQAHSIEGLIKLNLTVVRTNKAAKRLYEQCGFKVFGTETQALKVEEQFYDEDYMALVLEAKSRRMRLEERII